MNVEGSARFQWLESGQPAQYEEWASQDDETGIW